MRKASFGKSRRLRMSNPVTIDLPDEVYHAVVHNCKGLQSVEQWCEIIIAGAVGKIRKTTVTPKPTVVTPVTKPVGLTAAEVIDGGMIKLQAAIMADRKAGMTTPQLEQKHGLRQSKGMTAWRILEHLGGLK